MGYLAVVIVGILALPVHSTEDDVVMEEFSTQAIPGDMAQGFDRDIEELLEEDVSSDNDERVDTQPEHVDVEDTGAKKLASLEKEWKAKEKLAHTTFLQTAQAKKTQLNKDLHAEKEMKKNIFQQYSSQLQTSATKVTKAEAKKAEPKKSGKTLAKEAETAAAKAQLDTKTKQLAAKEASNAALKRRVQDEKTKRHLQLAKQKAQVKKSAAKKIAHTKAKYLKKADNAIKKLKKEHSQEVKLVKQVIKQHTKSATEHLKYKDMKSRNKKTEQKLLQVKKELSKVKQAAGVEKQLRKKAVGVAKKLGKKIKVLAKFGKKAAEYSKQKSVQAAKANMDAKDQMRLMRAQSVKQKEVIAHFNATVFMLRQQIQEHKAKNAAQRAGTVRLQAKHIKLHNVVSKLRVQLNETILEKIAITKQMRKLKALAKTYKQKNIQRKKEEKQTLEAMKKAEEVQKALAGARKQVAQYKHVNTLQRMELESAAEQEIKAANITKGAAQHAEAMEQQALQERHWYQKVMKKAKRQLSTLHTEKITMKVKFNKILAKVKKSLDNEHQLRLTAEAQRSNATEWAHKSLQEKRAATEQKLRTKHIADKISEERDRLSARTKACTDMIAVEREATTQAKKAAEDLQMADMKKITDLKSRYDKILKEEHDKSVKAQTIAATVSSRSQALKDAIEKEKDILHKEQEKARAQQLKWSAALKAFKKERAAHIKDKSSSEAATSAELQKAQLEIQKAQEIASDKDSLIAQLKDEVTKQAKKFADAAEGWKRVKTSLQLRTKDAEENAEQANEALAKFTRHTQKDAAAAAAESAVDEAAKEDEMPMDHDMEELQLSDNAELEDTLSSMEQDDGTDDNDFLAKYKKAPKAKTHD
jgi:hypothetical protein